MTTSEDEFPDDDFFPDVSDLYLNMADNTDANAVAAAAANAAPAMQQKKRNRKRKSPCSNMSVFKSPLSRMILSPRLHLWERYPSTSQRGLPEIDLNMPICNNIDLNTDPEEQVNLSSGGNGYDVPHIRKGMLERQGHLPLQLSCEASLVQLVMDKLNE